jgi:hypothetical protein
MGSEGTIFIFRHAVLSSAKSSILPQSCTTARPRFDWNAWAFENIKSYRDAAAFCSNHHAMEIVAPKYLVIVNAMVTY